VIGLEFKEALGGFFDREKVIKAVGIADKKVLSAQGQEVQYQAKGMLWPAKGPSSPGNPPHMHMGLIKKLLYFSYDFSSKSVVIGPAIIDRPTGAPSTLEYGGDAKMQDIVWKTKSGNEWKGWNQGPRTLHKIIRTIHILPRPYMKPALVKAGPKLAKLWQDSVH
jgi:hypothetical protein